MKIAIICPSEIALRRFMPALSLINEFEFVGLGICSVEERFGDSLPSEDIIREVLEAEETKAKVFIDSYGGKIFRSYDDIVNSNEIEALYIPLPPALHYKWAKKALEAGKHVLVEKPSTISSELTEELIQIAKSKGLALHENYMFAFHQQLTDIKEIIASGEIGDVRLYRIAFGFPMRQLNDFRYNKALGGGALIDAGGYTLKYAAMLLGDSAKIKYAQSNYIEGFDVDMYGSAAMVNASGCTVQLSFGMDNNYKCELEAWGSKGSLYTGRVLTAPMGFIPEVVIRKGNVDEKRSLSADDTFKKSIMRFWDCINSVQIRERNYTDILKQAKLVDEFKKRTNE